jgi:uncharacterized protein
MRSKRIDPSASPAKGSEQKTFAVIFETGDHVIEGLKQFAGEQGLAASHFTAIGASKGSRSVTSIATKSNMKIPVHEQVEALSLVGDITVNDGKPNIRAHVVLGRRDGSTRGGHLMEAEVRPTLEVILIESPAHLERRFNQEAGLPLITL